MLMLPSVALSRWFRFLFLRCLYGRFRGDEYSNLQLSKITFLHIILYNFYNSLAASSTSSSTSLISTTRSLDVNISTFFNHSIYTITHTYFSSVLWSTKSFSNPFNWFLPVESLKMNQHCTIASTYPIVGSFCMDHAY